MAISLTVSRVVVPGDRVTFTFTDALTGNTSSIALEERVFGVDAVRTGLDMLTRFASDICLAVNGLQPGGAVVAPLLDTGA